MLFTNVSVVFSDGDNWRNYKKVRYRWATLGRLVRRARKEGCDAVIVRADAGDGRTGETLCMVTFFG